MFFFLHLLRLFLLAQGEERRRFKNNNNKAEATGRLVLLLSGDWILKVNFSEA